MSHLSTIVHAAAAAGGFTLDPLTIGLVLLLVVMVAFMIRNSRKRRRDAEELKNKFVPGAEVMTQHGIYGTLISVDDEKNEAIIETTPGTRLRVHRQTIARVVEPADIDPSKDLVDDEPAEAEVNTDHAIPAGEPQYGERTTEAEKPKRAPRKKPATDQ
jgi:preprotein translocase subunit YajC